MKYPIVTAQEKIKLNHDLQDCLAVLLMHYCHISAMTSLYQVGDWYHCYQLDVLFTYKDSKDVEHPSKLLQSKATLNPLDLIRHPACLLERCRLSPSNSRIQYMRLQNRSCSSTVVRMMLTTMLHIFYQEALSSNICTMRSYRICTLSGSCTHQ